MFLCPMSVSCSDVLIEMIASIMLNDVKSSTFLNYSNFPEICCLIIY